MVTALLLMTFAQLPSAAPTAAAEQAPRNVVRGRALIPTIVGAAFAVGGAAALWVGQAQLHAALTAGLTGDALLEAQRHATSNVVGGTALLVAGAAVLGLSVVMWLWEPRSVAAAKSVAVVPLRDGGAVFARVELP